MKKSVAAFWAISLIVVVMSLVITAEAQAHFFEGRTLSLRDITIQLKTPEDVARYIWRNFRFESDQRTYGKDEYWASPEELLAKGSGDCEDFALFAQAILKANGIPSFLLNVYGEDFAHTVCVFKINGKYNVIDGSEVHYYESKDLKDLAAKIYPYWKKGAIVAQSSISHQGKLLTEIDRYVAGRNQMAQSA